MKEKMERRIEERKRRVVKTALRGTALLEYPLLNKATAFAEKERLELGLLGRLPPHVDTQDEQADRAYDAFSRKGSDIERHIYLRSLQDTNETLFYRLVRDHLVEMMPVIYTPVVGEACRSFSEIYRRPRGLFVSYPERERIGRMLCCSQLTGTRVIVVTDGERILGLGDQGVGGMGIPVGKLSLYTACGGINPAQTLPVLLDVGTNNERLLADPLYLGWRHERVAGDAYLEFVDGFVQGVKRRWPNVLLQFEDFAQAHAMPLLEKYRDELCMFNDDIQGTAAVVVGALLAATKVAGKRLRDLDIAVLGAGSAGCGIAEQLIAVMRDQGLSDGDARARLFMVDANGLLHDRLEGLRPFQCKLAQPFGRVGCWGVDERNGITLEEVVTHAKPGILIGVCGQPGLFTETIVREMASHVDRPMIFPMSNPTSRAEAIPADLVAWTGGRAIVATGSPFDPVTYRGQTFTIAQSNNSYIFPGMGLGILAVGATRVSDEMMMAASVALAGCSSATGDEDSPLLPPLSRSRELAKAIAIAVACKARDQGLAPAAEREDIERQIDETYWETDYPVIEPHV